MTTFPGFDVMAWADEIEAKLSLYTSVDLLRGDWGDKKAELHARDPERFRDLNLKCAAKALEITGRDAGAERLVKSQPAGRAP